MLRIFFLLTLFASNYDVVYTQNYIHLKNFDNRKVEKGEMYNIILNACKKYSVTKMELTQDEMAAWLYASDSISTYDEGSYINIQFTKSNANKIDFGEAYAPYERNAALAFGPYIMHIQCNKLTGGNKYFFLEFDAGVLWESGKIRDSSYYYFQNMYVESGRIVEKKVKQEMGWDNNSNTPDYVGAIGNIFKKKERYKTISPENKGRFIENYSGNYLKGVFEEEQKWASLHFQKKKCFTDFISTMIQLSAIAEMNAMVKKRREDSVKAEAQYAKDGFVGTIGNCKNGNGKMAVLSKTDVFGGSDGKIYKLEGQWKNEKLHGKGQIYNPYDNTWLKGYFIQSYFFIKEGFGGVDSTLGVYVLANNGATKIAINEIVFPFMGVSSELREMFKYRIFSYPTLKQIIWTGITKKGNAIGMGEIQVVSSDKGKQSIFKGEVRNGKLWSGSIKYDGNEHVYSNGQFISTKR